MPLGNTNIVIYLSFEEQYPICFGEEMMTPMYIQAMNFNWGT